MHEFILSAFSDEADPMLDPAMDILEPWKVRHIELRGADGRNVTQLTVPEAKEIRSRLESRGFAVSAVGSPIGKIAIDDPMDPHLELFRHTIELAHALGTKNIRLFSFFMPAGSAEANRAETHRRFEAMVRAAEGTGILMLHENEKDIYGDVAVRCRDLLDTFDVPHLRATFDPANFVQCGQKIDEAWALLKHKVAYVHIKDALFADGSVVPAGEGDGQVAWLLAQLAKSDYKGFLSLEPHLGQFDGLSSFEAHGTTIRAETAGARTFGVAASALYGLLDRM